MDYAKEALRLHAKWNGKLETVPKMKIENKDDLSIAYTPGVAAPCLEIEKDKKNSYVYTGRSHTVAVISDGSAVLGLGNIGPEAGMPVMEGKCVLFKALGNVDAVPLCLNTQDTDELVQIISSLEPSFGGINLEDIAAPRCFEVEKRLQEKMNIPVFHDDQHGTAVVAVSALMNGFKLIGKRFRDAKVVVNGAGAAGMAITRLLQAVGTKHIILCDTKGAIYEGRAEGMNPYKEDIARITNKRKEAGSLVDVIKGADVFIGVSVARCVTEEMVKSMNKDAIIMAMANPEPEIMPELAKKAGACIVCTGRSDFPNQVNNLLAFPGIFRGALDVRATDINTEMKIAAATAIASLIPEEELSEDNIIISPFDKRVAPRVASAVAQAAIDTGVATNDGMTAELVAEHTMEMLGA